VLVYNMRNRKREGYRRREYDKNYLEGKGTAIRLKTRGSRKILLETSEKRPREIQEGKFNLNLLKHFLRRSTK